MKKALIVAAGNTRNIELKEKYDFVIAADGGFDAAIKMGLKVDLFIGDMDSVKEESIDIPVLKLEVEKDFTDTEAAIEKAVSLGYKEIYLIGALGSRADHSLANIFLIKKYSEKGINLKIKDSHNEIFAISKESVIEGHKGKTISVLPLTEELKSLSLEGFYYPLSDKDVKMGETLTVSNVVTEDKAKISFKEGIALVIITKD